MTIVNQSSRRTVQGNGSQKTFDYNFLIPSQGYAELSLIDNLTREKTTLSPSVWSLSGVGNPTGGSFTYPIVAGAAAIPSTQSLVLSRKLPYVQVTSLQNQGGFQPKTLEYALDTLLMQILQVRDLTTDFDANVARTIRAPSVESGFSELPLSDLRRNTLLGFNGSGSLSLLPLQPGDNTTIIAQGTTTPRALAERFADRISVGDFGAAGDGVTDDTSAFNAALAATKSIYLDAGKVYSVSELTFSVGVQIYGDGAVLRARPGARWIAKMTGFGTAIHGLEFEDPAAYLVDQTSLASGALSGATVLTVSGIGRLEPMMTIAVELDNGRWHTTLIASVAGNNVTIQTALPSAAAASKRVWATHGALWLTNTLQWFSVDNVKLKNCWGGIVAKPTSLGTLGPVKGSVSRITAFNARMFAAACIGDSADIDWDLQNVFGAANVINTYTGDGFTTSYGLTDDVWRVGPTSDLTVTINNVPTTAFTLPTSRMLTFSSPPANGASISIINSSDGLVGFLADATGGTIIVGGHRLALRALDFKYGMLFRNSQLYALTDGFVDTISQAGVRFEGLNDKLTWNGHEVLFIGQACLEVASGATIVSSNFSALKTTLAPANEQQSGALGVALSLPSGSSVSAIDATSWGGTKSRNGTGSLITPGASGFSFNAAAFINPGLTRYLFPGFEVATFEYQTEWVAPFDGYISKLLALSTHAPGAGQTATITARVNAANTVAERVLTGASDFGGAWEGSVYVAYGQSITVQLVTSASATPLGVRGHLEFIRA